MPIKVMYMEEMLNEFKKYLYKEDKFGSLLFSNDKLEKNEVGIVDFYTKVLAPALNEMVCDIWVEHRRSSIVRSIIESCFKFVIKEKKEKHGNLNKGKVLVICPPEEYHELGARMAADFFELAGYDAVFVGANTPGYEFINSIKALNPVFVSISVSNPYNLFSTKEIIRLIRKKAENIKILVGGLAFRTDNILFKKVGADYHVDKGILTIAVVDKQGKCKLVAYIRQVQLHKIHA